MSTYHVLNAVWVGVLPMFVASVFIAIACYVVCCLNRIKNRCKQHRKHKAAKKAKRKLLQEQRQLQKEQQQLEKNKRSLLDLAVENGSIPSNVVSAHRSEHSRANKNESEQEVKKSPPNFELDNRTSSTSGFEKTNPPPPTYAQLRSSLTLNLNEAKSKGSPALDQTKSSSARLHSTNSHDNLTKLKPVDRRVLFKSSGFLNRQSSMNAGDFYVKFDENELIEPIVVQELNESPKSMYSRMQTLTRSVQQKRKHQFEKNPQYFSNSDKQITKSFQKISSPTSTIPSTQIFQIQQKQSKTADREAVSEKRKETVRINESVELVNGSYESAILIVKRDTTSVTETNEVKTGPTRQSSDSSSSRSKKTYKRHERNVRHEECENVKGNESTTSFSFNEDGVGADDEDTSVNEEVSAPPIKQLSLDKQVSTAKRLNKSRSNEKRSPPTARHLGECSVLSDSSPRHSLPSKSRLIKKPSKLALSSSNKVNSDIDLEEDLIFNDDDNDSLSSADMLPQTSLVRKSSLNSLNYKRRKNESASESTKKSKSLRTAKKSNEEDDDNGTIKYFGQEDHMLIPSSHQGQASESAFLTDSTIHKLPSPPSQLLNATNWNSENASSNLTSPVKTLVNFKSNSALLNNASSLSDIDPDENILKNLLVKTSKQSKNNNNNHINDGLC